MYFIVKVCLMPLLYHLIMTLWCLLPHCPFQWLFSLAFQFIKSMIFVVVVVSLESWNWSSGFLQCTSSLPLPQIYPFIPLVQNWYIFLYAFYVIQVFKSLDHVNHNSKDVVWRRIIVWCNIVTLVCDKIHTIWKYQK